MSGESSGDSEAFSDLLKVPSERKPLWFRVVLFLGAAGCMLLGVVGWLVPVVTGIPFYILGLVLLSMAHPPLARWVNLKERGFSPRVRKALRPRLRRRSKVGKSTGRSTPGDSDSAKS
ncbi:MAG: hypothetical protein P8N09_11280 [Planctomycetota bacterium]|nr:hypothetical protein [Planctomycetota bacterium]